MSKSNNNNNNNHDQRVNKWNQDVTAWFIQTEQRERESGKQQSGREEHSFKCAPHRLRFWWMNVRRFAFILWFFLDVDENNKKMATEKCRRSTRRMKNDNSRRLWSLKDTCGLSSVRRYARRISAVASASIDWEAAATATHQQRTEKCLHSMAAASIDVCTLRVSAVNCAVAVVESVDGKQQQRQQQQARRNIYWFIGVGMQFRRLFGSVNRSENASRCIHYSRPSGNVVHHSTVWVSTVDFGRFLKIF